MSKSSHEGETDLTQNQNNAMSDDPGDGSRNSSKTGGADPEGMPGAPEAQDKDRLEDIGRKGSKQG